MLPDNAEWQSRTQAFQEKSHTYFFQSSLATTWHLPFYSSAPHRSCESAQTKLCFISRHSSPRKKFWEMEVASKIMNHRGWMWNNSHETPPEESCWNFKVPALAFVLQGKKTTFPSFIRLHLKSQKELKRAGNAEGKGIREQRAVKGIWQGNQLFILKGTLAFPRSASVSPSQKFSAYETHLKREHLVEAFPLRGNHSNPVAATAVVYMEKIKKVMYFDQFSSWKGGKTITQL